MVYVGNPFVPCCYGDFVQSLPKRSGTDWPRWDYANDEKLRLRHDDSVGSYQNVESGSLELRAQK